jgi:hypothetical protein
VLVKVGREWELERGAFRQEHLGAKRDHQGRGHRAQHEEDAHHQWNREGQNYFGEGAGHGGYRDGLLVPSFVWAVEQEAPTKGDREADQSSGTRWR